MSRAATRTCSAISRAFRLRLIPSSPVAQNLHAIGHPTCVEMQTVCLPRSGIMTVSMACPSCVWKRYFLVPSVALEALRRSSTAAGAASFKAPRRPFGRLVASSQSRTRETVSAE